MTELAAVPPAKEEITLELDPDSLTIGEVEDIESVSGRPITQMLKAFENQEFSAKELLALVWIIQRRTNPEFTLDDARKTKMSALTVGDSSTPS